MAIFPLVSKAATPSLYQVEIIVFKHRPGNPNTETWPQEPQWPAINSAVNLQPPLKQTPMTKPQPKPGDEAANDIIRGSVYHQDPPLEPDVDKMVFHYLDKKDFKLNSQEKRLTNSKNYQVLMHIAWLQGDESKPIHIFAGQLFDQNGGPINSQADPYQPKPVVSNDGLQWELDGTLEVTKNRYFKVNSNLILTKPSPKPKHSWFSRSTDQPPLSHYLLDQSQRMKSGELHYFDNPMYGLLVQITPYKDKTNQAAD